MKRRQANGCFRRNTAQAVRAMLEMVVEPGGTAPRARIIGYRVAGKTGTAHKEENGGYAKDKYVASFVGLAPASDPRLIVAVMIDEPEWPVLRRPGGCAGIQQRDGRRAAHAVRAARRANHQHPAAG